MSSQKPHKRSNAQPEEASLDKCFTMTDTTLDQLHVLVKKELTEYSTCKRTLSAISENEENSKNAFGIRIGAKRRRLDQPAEAEAETDETEAERALHMRWRMKMIGWQFKFIDHLDLDRDLVSIATNYLDRYCLEHPRPIQDLRTSQLLTLTCLYMAIKLFEFRIILTKDARTTMDALLKLTNPKPSSSNPNPNPIFTKKEMESMEYKILDTLKWHVHPPTEKVFIAHFMSIIPTRNPRMVGKLTTYVTELALLDPFFASYRKSEIAFAALLYSRGNILDDQESPVSLKLSQSQDRDYDLQNPRIKLCYDRLAVLHRQNDEDFFKDSALENGRVGSPVSVMAPLDK